VARESIVLLQNRDAVLPIKPETRSLAIVGALAESADDQLGPHAARGRSDEAVTLLQGIRDRARAANTSVAYEPGCSPDCKSADDFEKAIAMARDADAIIAVLGEPQAMSGEAASRASLALAGRQGELLDALIATGRPVVLLIVGGRPVEIGPWLDRVPAVAMTWYLGTEGGHAVADILFGDVSPSAASCRSHGSSRPASRPCTTIGRRAGGRRTTTTASPCSISMPARSRNSPSVLA
jgi:beta-glucosidase